MQDALSIHNLVVLLERLAADAVPPGVGLLVEVVGRLLEDLLDQFFHSRLVGGIGGSNELIVRDPEQAPDLLRALGDRIDELLRRHFPLRRGLRHLLSVLVHSDEEVHVVAHQAMVAGYGVGAELLEGMTLVGVSGGVIDGAGKEVLGQLLIS